MKHSVSVAIIGGGASGMMAAVAAARGGARVVILERQDRVGRKLLVTGNGRCNLCNLRCATVNYHGRDPGFAAPALAKFGPSAALEFFESLGVLCREEDNGKVFPLVGQASAVLDALRLEVERLGVTVQTGFTACTVRPAGNGFVIRSDAGEARANRVVVAGGGAAMPQVGGSDSCVKILGALGHDIVPVTPALVPLKTDMPYKGHLKGLKLDARVWVIVDQMPAPTESGELLFTDYGLSGPPIIQLSLHALAAERQGRNVCIGIDLFPQWTEHDLERHIVLRRDRFPDTPAEKLLIGLVHKRLVHPLLSLAHAAPDHPLAPEHPRSIAAVLKKWRCTVTGSLSWRDAQAMAGGIATAGFSPETLESGRVKGLFAAGEVLDITGDCGGYNLQWAWSSGHIAGTAAAGA